MSGKKKRNCEVCGGFLDHVGNCSKCYYREAEAKRVNELEECRKELAKLKGKERRCRVTIEEQWWDNLTATEARNKVRALMDLSITFLRIDKI